MVGGAAPLLQSKTATQNGVVTPDAGYDGLSSVIVNVSGGSGDVPMITEMEWNTLNTEQKQTYGLVAIQGEYSGFMRGKLVYGASYLPDPTIVYANSRNGATTGVLTYTFLRAGKYTVIATHLGGDAGQKFDLEIALNGNVVNSTYLYPTTNNNIGINIFIAEVTASVNDVITVSNTQNYYNSGVQMFVLTELDISNISFYNSASNNGATFQIQANNRYYLQVAHCGYYNGNNRFEYEIDNKNKISTATPNESGFWYGGTYVIMLTTTL